MPRTSPHRNTPRRPSARTLRAGTKRAPVVEAAEQPAPRDPAGDLRAAANRAAWLMKLPPLLLKAFMGVEGANVNHPDGVLQTTAPVRPGLVRRLSREIKLDVLNLSSDSQLSDDVLNARFLQAFDERNLLAQTLLGAQEIRENLDRFHGYVALAGLGYNLGPFGAQRVVNQFGGDFFETARQYNRKIGTGPDDVTVQPGQERVDGATGARYIFYPVTANDTGEEIPDFLYLRRVPNRNFGLLDFVYNPALLASRGLFADDAPPPSDDGQHALMVADGQFVGVRSPQTQMFVTQPLSQRDPRWKDILLGDQSVYTIGTDGCTLTCITMMANGFGYAETPATLNDKLKASGGFYGALIVWQGVETALPGLDLQLFVRCRDVPAPMGDVDAALMRGVPVIVELDQSPQPGFQNHWVLIYAKQGNDYLIHDPFPWPTDTGPVSLTTRYGTATAATPERIITAVLIYEKDGWTPPNETLTVVVQPDPDVLVMGGLAVRAGASIANAIVTRAAADSALVVLEPSATAGPKIGRYGEWLSVRTAEGITGFVAAWLVRAAAQTPASRAAFEPMGGARPKPDQMQPPLRMRAKPAPTPKARSIGAKASPIVVRAAPSDRAKAIARLAAGTALSVAEPRKVAAAKMGQPGAWIRVKLAREKFGYVEGSVFGAPSVTDRDAPIFEAAAAADETAAADPRPPVRPRIEPDERPLVAVINSPEVIAAGGLNFRSTPVSGAVLRKLPVGTQLYVRESRGLAEAKLGVQGQWLSLATLDNVAGYAAAWFLEKSLGWETPPPPPPPIPPEVVAQGVALANSETPLLNAPSLSASSSWQVSTGTPLRVIEGGDWASKIANGVGFVQVESYAFKRGFAQSSRLTLPSLPDMRVKAVDAQLPFGTCAWVYGMHDPFDRALFDGASKQGWVLFTEVVGGGQGRNYDDWAGAGYGVVARLNNDYGGSGTIPTPDRYAWFAERCASWVRNSRRCNIWVIGNEMNNPREWPNQGSVPGSNPADAITPERYAACFNQVRAAIKAVQTNAIVVPGAVDPFNAFVGDNLSWFTRMLGGIGELDGLALHAYTHGPEASLVTSLQTFNDDPLRWQYYHFRCYSTYLDAIPSRWRGRPVYLTEANAGWNASGTQPPWSGGQNGWVQAANSEIARYNNQHHAQQIQCLVLYRWELSGDAQDARYAISIRPGVQADFRATVLNSDYRWRK